MSSGPNLLVEWEPRWHSFVSSIRPAFSRAPEPYLSRSDRRLFVYWEPRWHNFKTSIGPALARSRPALLGECTVSMRPGRSIYASTLMHVSIVLFFLLVFTHAIRTTAYEHVDPYLTFNPNEYKIVYYPGHELPQMRDAGGAQEGLSGKSGGRELYHPTQTIRIARGNKFVDVIVDAPSIKLPRSDKPVANILSLPSGALVAPPSAAVQSAASRLRMDDITPIPAAPSAPARKLPNLPYDAQVVPPRPNASQQVAGMRLPDTGIVQPVPAPFSAVPRDQGYVPKLPLPATAVVAPAPDASLPIGNSNVNGPRIATVQMVDVIPPAPSLSGSGNGNGTGGGGIIGSALNALGSLVGSGTVSAAPPSGEPGGGAGGMGLIVSANPGGEIGVPNGGPGSMAMSPNGGNQPGMGGSGGGTGIGRGTGPGSGSSGSGPGAGSKGSGLGLGAAYPGTSLGPGPGGSGSGQGTPGGIRGVTVEGGHVSLPSFATASNSPGSPSRGPKEKRNTPPITIIATSRSGGAVNLYGTLKGAKVYTIYIDTAIGTALLQYAEHSAQTAEFAADLAAPEPMNYAIPAGTPRSRVLLSCLMDKSGALKNIRILESARDDVTRQVISAVERWRFRPVLKGDDPVDVDVILGFNIDTSQ